MIKTCIPIFHSCYVTPFVQWFVHVASSFIDGQLLALHPVSIDMSYIIITIESLTTTTLIGCRHEWAHAQLCIKWSDSDSATTVCSLGLHASNGELAPEQESNLSLLHTDRR